MLGRATGAVLVGVDARLVEVEVHLGGGLPGIAAVGLPGSAVREGIDRLRAALPQAGFKLPQRRIIVNLAPADIRKQGAGLDLPIAVALLAADSQIQRLPTEGAVLVGELALDGTLRPVRGALSFAMAAREAGRGPLVVPRANVEEARLAEGVDVVGVGSLADVAAFTRGIRTPQACMDRHAALREVTTRPAGPDLAEVRGQAVARRALEVAAAGGHHLLLVGLPGSGKTMLARRLPGILPPMTLEEAIDVTRVWSAAGLCNGLVTVRPFRSPHHGISFAGLTGGGPRLRPGEVSLANHGVLYLDEFPEFRRDVLEALRQPLEEGRISVVRVHESATFPTRFMLVASMNPCPCGHHGRPDGRCSCTPAEIRRYLGKLSGPLLDRFDLVVEMPPVNLDALTAVAPGEPSETVRQRVIDARSLQQHRYGLKGAPCNARMNPAELAEWVALTAGPLRLLVSACGRLGLSARGFDRVRRVARTLADLDGSREVHEPHLAEAVQYRRTLGSI